MARSEWRISPLRQSYRPAERLRAAPPMSGAWTLGRPRRQSPRRRSNRPGRCPRTGSASRPPSAPRRGRWRGRVCEDRAWLCFLLTLHATGRRSEATGCNPGSGRAMISIDWPVCLGCIKPHYSSARLIGSRACRHGDRRQFSCDLARPQGLREAWTRARWCR